MPLCPENARSDDVRPTLSTLCLPLQAATAWFLPLVFSALEVGDSFLSKCTLKTLGTHVNLSQISFTMFYSVSCACLGWGTGRKVQYIWYICLHTTPFKHSSLTFPMFSISWRSVSMTEWGRSSSDTFCSFCMTVCSISCKMCKHVSVHKDDPELCSLSQKSA